MDEPNYLDKEPEKKKSRWDIEKEEKKRFLESRKTCKLVATQIDYDSWSCEVWSCGLGNQHRASGEPLTSEPEHKHESSHLQVLQGSVEAIKVAFEDVDEHSSEGSYVPFFVNVFDNPKYLAKSSAEKIINQVFEDCDFGGDRPLTWHEGFPIEAFRLFDDYTEWKNNECYEDAVQAMDTVIKILESTCVKNTAFWTEAQAPDLMFIGSIFMGARTSRGDLLGVSMALNWR